MGNNAAPLRRQVAGVPLSKYLYCGMNSFGVANADTYVVTANIMTQLIPQTSGTLLRTRISGSAQQDGMSTNPVSCTSNGDLEKRIAQLVREKVLR